MSAVAIAGTLARPLLLYDGDCAFCRYWVRYWQRLTGDTVDYEPFQARLDDLRGLGSADCRRAVQLFEPDGRHASAAAASLRVLELGGAPAFGRCYRRSRLFARLAESAYKAVAARRDTAYGVARLCWGGERHPARYALAQALFTRLLALVYVAAFASLAVQIVGLIGSQGILPVGELLAGARRALGADAYFALPSVFWLAHGDSVLLGSCVLGAALGLLAALGRAQWPALAACYLLYLSLFTMGRDFMSFQWDLLLLECGFLCLLRPLGTPLLSMLYRLLLFRFMFLSGCVKLLSGDPSWSTLAALDFHYFTQPLPTPLAWYAHQLPAWFDRLCVAGTFVVELLLPFLIFAPRRPRLLAAGGFIVLQTFILLTGNYNFFNLLTLALCLFLFDDALFGRGTASRSTALRRHWTLRAAFAALAVTIVLHNLYFLARPFVVMPRALDALIAPLAPLRMVNGYGLFAVMTTTRPEIEVEGSHDGRHWQAYTFAYKPGAPSMAPRWNIPHQPRLDWQMWFAALASADRTPWFGNFLVRLLENAPDVTALLRTNPFAEDPPRYVRAVLYDYRFASLAERRSDGVVWVRRTEGLYFPPVRLR